MTRRAVTVSEGVARQYGGRVLMREVYRLTRNVDDSAMVRPSDETLRALTSLLHDPRAEVRAWEVHSLSMREMQEWSAGGRQGERQRHAVAGDYLAASAGEQCAVLCGSATSFVSALATRRARRRTGSLWHRAGQGRGANGVDAGGADRGARWGCWRRNRRRCSGHLAGC